LIQEKSYSSFKKAIWFLLATISFFTAIGIDRLDNNTQITPVVQQKIQVSFLNHIKDLEKQVDKLLKGPIQQEVKNLPTKTNFFLHIFQNNELVYWNTNQLPISSNLSNEEIKNGVYKLSNGYYYIYSCIKDELIVQGSLLLQSSYELENEYLENEFNRSIYDGVCPITITKKSTHSIHDNKGKPAFFISNTTQSNPFTDHSNTTFIFLMFSFIAFLLGLYFITRGHHYPALISFFLLILIRYLAIYYVPINLFSNQEYQSASLFPFNTLFPTILGLTLNIGILIYGFFVIVNIVNTRKNKIWSHVFLFILFILWWLILDFIKILVENADVSLTLDLPFTLTLYSYVLIVIVAALFYSFYYGFVKTIKQLSTSPKLIKKTWFFICLATLLFIFFRTQTQEAAKISMLLPLLLMTLISLGQLNTRGNKNVVLQLFILALFSSSFIKELNTHNQIKEREIRKLYANQLLLDRDYEAEINYSSFQSALINDTHVLQLFNYREINPIPSHVGDFFERSYFSGIWDGYELGVTMFDSSLNTILSKDGFDNYLLSDLIENHSQQSEINPAIFFLKDSYLGYSYLIKQALPHNKGTLVFSLKSKKIPEEIGFPRLLLSKQANVLNGIANYSIAKYFNGKLAKQHGEFHFPTNLSFLKTIRGNNDFIEYGEYNHYVLFKGSGTAVVLSEKTKTNYDVLTSFSYVFCFWGLLLVLINTTYLLFKRAQYRWTLALKIQLMSVSLVVLSLVFFGAVSGLFVSRQYELFNSKSITDEVKSISTELNNKTTKTTQISKVNDGTFFELLTEKLSVIFETDINIYDLKGRLVAGSKPEVFSLGLQSEQINPRAYYELKSKHISLHSQKENIGKLSFYSVYMPIYNGKNEALGYLNIQHFNKQRDFERQIQSFLVSIMNIFILLLTGAIIISLLVSNRLVQPLKQLQLKVKAINFGKRNQHIVYASRDEISTVVDAYNNKLDELEEAIKQLKSNERESAWREMAKQVAHEIKNPLTPIKLSVQQLLRVYDANDPESKLKIEVVVKAIIEQIDNLVKIANDFSLFAQLPVPIKKETDLILLIKNILPMFLSYNNIKISLESSLEKCFVNIDKDQWLQVFNNLIKNAAQACSDMKKPIIQIYVRTDKQMVIIEIKDNGCGIPPDQIEKIFTPHFTTKSTGSGIGLSLTKQIIENHDGQISFISTINKGTTFTIRLG
jgi:signal transduction histidine kinase